MNKVVKVKHMLVILVINLIIMTGAVYAEIKLNSNEIYYDNSLSKIEANEV